MNENTDIAYLEYCFFMELPSPWNNVYDFEKDLNTFFDSFGLEASIVSAVKGYDGKKVVYLKKKPTPPPAPVPPKSQGKAPAIQIKGLTSDYGKPKN